MAWRAMPLVPVAAAFAAGIALAPWTPPAVAWAIWLIAVVAAATLALARPRVATVSLLLAVAATGALRATAVPLPPDHVAHLSFPRIARVEGRLAAAPTRWAPERTRLLLDVERVDGTPRVGRLQLAAYGVLPPVTEDQRIAAESRLHRASGFRNPGGFDYAAHLAREGILVVGTTRAERVVALEPERPSWHTRVRRRAIEAMGAALPPVSAALLAGLLLGERVDLPPELHDAFRRAGVYHVLAVSGFNVALVAAAAWGLLAAARASRRVASAGAIVVVIGFAVVVGPEPSVLRATIMAVLVLAALLLEREAAVANSLALAALVILAVRPGDLADPGFQLSFAATAGIVLAPLPRGVVAGALGVSLAAQLAVLPITLSHFNQLSTIGVIANLGVVPLAALATVVGLVATALAFASDAAAGALFAGVWPVLLVLRWIVALAAAVPGAVVYLPAPGAPAIVCYVAALAAALAAWRLRASHPRRTRLAGATALPLLLVAVTLAAWPVLRPPDGRLRVTVLDVGQADAIVIEAPDGRVVLVDAGAGGPHRLDTGERVVAPFLWNHGILRLHATLITHDDVDHAGGMPAIHRRFAVSERWDRESLGREPRWLGGVMITMLHARAAVPDPQPHPGAPSGGAAAGAKVGGEREPDEGEPSETRSLPGGQRVTAEMETRTGDLGADRVVEAGSPRPAPSPPPQPRSRASRNNEAIVLRVEYGLASFLLASDIEAAAEAALVAARRPLGATVLKVAHHGSRTSSTPGFLGAVRPTLAVISVGARNAYGHPDAGTLGRLEVEGARLYRTDRDGALIFETDGRALAVTRWATRQTERDCLDPEAIC